MGACIAIIRIGRSLGGADWVCAWVCLYLGGLAAYVAQTQWFGHIIYPALGTLFVGFYVSGSIRFVGLDDKLRQWWIAVGVLALLRTLPQPFVEDSTSQLVGTLVVTMGALAASFLHFQEAWARKSRADQLLSFIFLAPALAQNFYAYWRSSSADASSGLFIWLMVGTVVVMIQLIILIERVRRESELQQHTLALLASAAPVGLCLVSGDGAVQAANGQAKRLLSGSVQNIVGASMEQLLATCAGLPVATLQSRSIVDETLRFDHNTYIRVNRHEVHLSGEDLGFVWFFEDVSAQVELRDLLPKSQHLEALQTLSAGVAHVFNNHLQVINGNVEFIRAETNNPMIHAYLDELDRASDQCGKVTRDFLSVAQNSMTVPSSNGLVELLQEVLQEVVEVYALEVDMSRLEPAGIQVDSTAFKRAFEEILNNAVEAGASRVEISSAISTPNQLDLSVRDDGCGLSAEVEERAFEPFFTTQDGIGMGLGLSVVMGIVQAHGGQALIRTATPGSEVVTTWPLVSQALELADK